MPPYLTGIQDRVRSVDQVQVRKESTIKLGTDTLQLEEGLMELPEPPAHYLNSPAPAPFTLSLDPPTTTTRAPPSTISAVRSHLRSAIRSAIDTQPRVSGSVSFGLEYVSMFSEESGLIRSSVPPHAVRRFDVPRSAVSPSLWWTMGEEDRSSDVLCVIHGMALIDRGDTQRHDSHSWVQRNPHLWMGDTTSGNCDQEQWRASRDETQAYGANTRSSRPNHGGGHLSPHQTRKQRG
jgi:hypothetical protein